MKRALLWLLAALLAGTLAGQLMIDDPGYLVLSWHHYVVETSVWVAIAGLIALFLAMLATVGLLGAVTDVADALRRWRAERRARRALALTQAGLAQFAAADWRKATSTLLKAAELVDAPLLVRITAARAAELDGRGDLAEQVLRDSRTLAGDARALVDEALAALKAREGDLASARLVLEKARDRHPKHPLLLRQLADLYVQAEAWQPLAGLLPALQKLLDEDAWRQLARRACSGHLAQVAGETGYPSRKARVEALMQAWKALSPELRADEVIAGTCASLLARHEAIAEAQALLEKTLGTAWSDALVTQYGRLEVPQPAAQLAALEQWLPLRPTNAALLLAAGRASLRNKLWGKARDYFEASAARHANAENCAELVRLYTRLGDNAKADHYLRRHVELVGSTLPALPLPSARL